MDTDEPVNMIVVSSEKKPLPEKKTDEPLWIPYEDSKNDSPVLNKLCGMPCYYKFRWKILQCFHLRLPFGICLGEILFIIIVLGFFAGLGANSGYNTGDSVESTGSLAGMPATLTFAFATRNSVFILLTGLPFERALKWHKLFAVVSVILGIWHGLVTKVFYKEPVGTKEHISNSMVMSGIGLTAAMGGLLVFSIPYIRRNHFETFLRFHWILIGITLFFTAAHGAGTMFPGIFLWAFDLVVRFWLSFFRKGNHRNMLAVQLPSNVVRLTFKKGDFSYKAGQYMFVCVPGITPLEWHPFSISSSPHEDKVSIHVRVLGDWTKRLHDYAKETKEIKVYMDGTYGAPCLDIDGDRYKYFIFISGGIGITPMQSICNDITHQYKRGRKIKKIMFIWSVRDLYMVSSVLDYDKEYIKNENQSLPRSFSPNLLKQDGADDILENYFHLTKERDEAKFEEANIKPELQPNLKFGRPKLKELFTKMKDDCKGGNESRVAVLTCGPSGLVNATKNLCLENSKDGVKFDFHKELFEF